MINKSEYPLYNDIIKYNEYEKITIKERVNILKKRYGEENNCRVVRRAPIYTVNYINSQEWLNSL